MSQHHRKAYKNGTLTQILYVFDTVSHWMLLVESSYLVVLFKRNDWYLVGILLGGWEGLHMILILIHS